MDDTRGYIAVNAVSQSFDILKCLGGHDQMHAESISALGDDFLDQGRAGFGNSVIFVFQKFLNF